MKPVIQEERTGCGIAAVANILGKTYAQMKTIANTMGIYAEDTSLWSDTQYVRRMLASAGVATSAEEKPFSTWDALPDLALLSIKYHREGDKDFWHWWCLNVSMSNQWCLIPPVICPAICEQILRPCSLNGLLK